METIAFEAIPPVVFMIVIILCSAITPLYMFKRTTRPLWPLKALGVTSFLVGVILLLSSFFVYDIEWAGFGLILAMLSLVLFKASDQVQDYRLAKEKT